MKAWLAGLPLVIGLSTGAIAQTSATEDARAAELACQLAGLCGDAAQAEADREKEAIEGVETRGLPSMNALLAAGKSASSSRSPAATNRETSERSDPARAQVSRTARRSIPASVGRRAPAPAAALASVDNSAADVPGSVARRAPLFVTFGLKSAQLTPESAAEVQSFANALKAIAESGQNKRYRIEGHTDASGNEASNLVLSQQRAASVRDALIAAGVASDRIEVVGLGSEEPIQGYAKSNPLNRRVEAVEIK